MKNFGIRRMVSFDDMIDYFRNIKPNTKDEEMHERILNRLEYENEKSKGVVIKKVPKLNGRDYFVKCGKCGSEAVKEAWYRYCPNCGYKIIRESEE